MSMSVWSAKQATLNFLDVVQLLGFTKTPMPLAWLSIDLLIRRYAAKELPEDAFEDFFD